MKITAIILAILINLNSFSQTDMMLEELNNHLKRGNISHVLGSKLEKYFKEGNKIDDSDWLFFLTYKFHDEENLQIADLIKSRHEIINVNSYDIVDFLNNSGFNINTENVKKERYKIKRRELIDLTVNYALKDNNKAFLKDLEADVCKGNEAYLYFIKELSKISDKKFEPINLIEKWDTETGPIYISFEVSGKKIEFSPEYMDDWIDGRFIEKLNENLKAEHCGFYTIIADYILGQEVLIMFLYEEETKKLEKEFGWQLVKI